MCPLLGGSTVHKEEDNLSIVDKMAGPNVSFIPVMLFLWPCFQIPVGPPSEVEEIFDAISYAKGSCVIRMLHDWIGTEVRVGTYVRDGQLDEGWTLR